MTHALRNARDYPVPSYAGYIWWNNRTICLSTTRGVKVFDDTPLGLAELRIALLDLSDPRRVVSVAHDDRVTRYDKRGRVERTTLGDLFEEGK